MLQHSVCPDAANFYEFGKSAFGSGRRCQFMHTAVLSGIRRARMVKERLLEEHRWACQLCQSTTIRGYTSMLQHCYVHSSRPAFCCLICGRGSDCAWKIRSHVKEKHRNVRLALGMDPVSDNRSELDIELAVVAANCFGRQMGP